EMLTPGIHVGGFDVLRRQTEAVVGDVIDHVRLTGSEPGHTLAVDLGPQLGLEVHVGRRDAGVVDLAELLDALRRRRRRDRDIVLDHVNRHRLQARGHGGDYTLLVLTTLGAYFVLTGVETRRRRRERRHRCGKRHGQTGWDQKITHAVHGDSFLAPDAELSRSGCCNGPIRICMSPPSLQLAASVKGVRALSFGSRLRRPAGSPPGVPALVGWHLARSCEIVDITFCRGVMNGLELRFSASKTMCKAPGDAAREGMALPECQTHCRNQADFGCAYSPSARLTRASAAGTWLMILE